MLPHSPAADRNKAPILEQLSTRLTPGQKVLEIASGTGQHVVHFATALPKISWQPSEKSQSRIADLRDRIRLSGLKNIRSPIALDVTDPAWAVPTQDAIYCANMVHIAPWSATIGLFSGATTRLGDVGLLILYGPFRFSGRHTAPSNAAFDENLRLRDPSWGVRDLDDVSKVAAESGLELSELVQLPANNHLLVFKKRATPKKN